MNQSAKQILLVENSKTIRAAVEIQLTNSGYRFSSVSSGKDAVNMVQQESFDLVVMDLFLPELNGYEAAKEIRKLGSERANIPIIAYSSSTNPFDKSRCKEAGMNEYVLKTTDHQPLVDKIGELLNKDSQ